MRTRGTRPGARLLGPRGGSLRGPGFLWRQAACRPASVPATTAEQRSLLDEATRNNQTREIWQTHAVLVLEERSSHRSWSACSSKSRGLGMRGNRAILDLHAC